MKHLLAFILIALFQTSCVSMAKRPLLLSELSELKIGQINRSEIIEKYGLPQKETLSGELINYCYFYATISEKHVLFIQFDKNDRLKKKHFDDKVANKECSSIIPETFDNNANHSSWSKYNS